MKNTKKDNDLVLEEQKILDNLIDKMDAVIDELGAKALEYVQEAKAAREAGIIDNYYAFIMAKNGLKDTEENRKKLMQTRDELYDQRVEVYINDDSKPTSIQIGDTNFVSGAENFVTSRNRPICRAFWGGQMPENYEFDSIDDNGKFVEHVKCRLSLGRNIDLHFSKVRNVKSVFPLTTEEQDELIVDTLTQELLERRSDNEWKSILRSIQNKQKEIVLAPLNKNIIVQGCAGSGKTMIMLHRLPIVLMDNPDVLRKNNIYVITPSKIYIQLAKNMIRKYDIADVSMGVLKDYYDYCINKYTFKGTGYGEINPSIILTKESHDYIYSRKCINDISDFYEKIFRQCNIDIKEDATKLGLTITERKENIIANKLQGLFLDLNKVLNENDKIVQEVYRKFRNMTEIYQRFASALTGRQDDIIRTLRKLISKSERAKKKAEKELLKLDREVNEIAWKNRENIISRSDAEIEYFSIIITEVKNNTEYFNQYKPVIARIGELSNLFQTEKNNNENHVTMSYKLISKFQKFKKLCVDIENDYYRVEEKYSEYGDVPAERFQEAKSLLFELENLKIIYLDESRREEINRVCIMLSKKIDTAVYDAYFNVMKKLGVKTNDKEKIQALSCSPYVFLQALYLYFGSPNSAKESLITIDEAQSVALEEIRLIKNLNDNNVILNLFGDVRQHIEGTKGLDSWNEIDNIMDYTFYELRENYRNAVQITEYCNDNLDNIKMYSMNTEGKGVHELRDEGHLLDKMTHHFMDVNRIGLAAIIVKDIYEADYIKEIFLKFELKLFDMAGDEFSVHRTKWNIITVEEAKGLEFSTVMVISGNMTPNEKYIAYTRALDELLVYNKSVDTKVYIERRLQERLRKQQKIENDKQQKKKSYSEKMKVNSKKEKNVFVKKIYMNSAVRKFFEEKGMEVIDNRSQRGHLWVIGEKEEISDVVNQAVKEFKIMGQYKASKETNSRKGWCTKTKK